MAPEAAKRIPAGSKWSQKGAKIYERLPKWRQKSDKREPKGDKNKLINLCLKKSPNRWFRGGPRQSFWEPLKKLFLFLKEEGFIDNKDLKEFVWADNIDEILKFLKKI